MDRAFLARLLIVPVDSLIVSVDSLIVLAGGIRGREIVWNLSMKNTVFFLLRSGQGMRILRIRRILRMVGRECELGELSEFYEFFLSLVVVCEFWANGNE